MSVSGPGQGESETRSMAMWPQQHAFLSLAVSALVTSTPETVYLKCFDMWYSYTPVKYPFFSIVGMSSLKRRLSFSPLTSGLFV